MIGWIILIVAFAAVFLLNKFVHFRNFKHKFWVIAIILLLLFIIFSFSKVASNNSVSLGSPSGIFSAVQLYFSWLGQAFDNIKVITGNMIRMDWFPKN